MVLYFYYHISRFTKLDCFFFGFIMATILVLVVTYTGLATQTVLKLYRDQIFKEI